MPRCLIIALCLITTATAMADPQRYRLDTARSTVSFTYGFNGSTKQGQMPIKSADLMIDLQDVSRSKVSVTLNPQDARAGFIFATEAMKSAQVLDTRRFPTIQFRSTRITGRLNNAAITGDLTIRGQTRPITLRAGLFRQRGTDPDDRNNLLILLTGSVSRAVFGATGYPKLVGDQIGLRIIARITK